jgi:CubicO group peptidase (beta-lactamase class C family)
MLKNLSIIILIFLGKFLCAQSEDFSKIIQEYHSKNNFNGVVILATNGKIDFVKSIGFADREQNIQISDSSKFKLASITKTFTAVLIMKLVEEQIIDLNNTISDYLPDFKGEGKNEITIHNLLTYSSGLENKLGRLAMTPYQSNISIDDFIDKYCANNLVFEPGEKSVYGNTEYILLHKIIETVTKDSYENYLKEVILVPIGMKNTGVPMPNKVIKNLCTGYLYNDSLNTFYKEEPYYTHLYFGSGALFSTAEDLLKFDQAIFNNKILSKSTTDKMLTLYPEYGFTAYGLWGSSGWGNFNERFYYRTGGIEGANANWIHTVDKGKTIIVLSNTNATNLYELSEKLYLASIKN